METLAVIVALLLLAVVGINHINSRYEKKKSTTEGPSADDLIAQAWDEFGGDEAPALVRRRVDRLSNDVKIESITQKNSVIQYAVMAARCERLDVIPPLAERAEAIDGGCGETRTLRALSEALTGSDMQKAVEAIQLAQSAVAGCSKCSSSIESQLLAQELAVAAGSLEDRFAEERANRMAPAGESRVTAPPSAHGALSVRLVRNG
jgi:hypothetical protein